MVSCFRMRRSRKKNNSDATRPRRSGIPTPAPIPIWMVAEFWGGFIGRGELVWLVWSKLGFGLGDLVVEILMVLLEMVLLEMVLLEMVISSEFVRVIDCIEQVEGSDVAIHR